MTARRLILALAIMMSCAAVPSERTEAYLILPVGVGENAAVIPPPPGNCANLQADFSQGCFAVVYAEVHP